MARLKSFDKIDTIVGLTVSSSKKKKNWNGFREKPFGARLDPSCGHYGREIEQKI